MGLGLTVSLGLEKARKSEVRALRLKSITRYVYGYSGKTRKVQLLNNTS